MKTMPTMLGACAAFFLCVSAAVAEEKAPAPDRAELEKRFAEKMSNSKMVGYWSLWGKEDKPQRDTYTLGKVSKVEGDKWTFEARIQFGDVDVTVPVPVEVKWAGTTPVITVDKVAIPAVGTYSARVVIHDDHYAATWDGGDHGGYMWGKVVKTKDEPKGKDRSKK
jgi:hypothetical protein